MTVIQTFTGRMVDVTNPKREDIALADIAHALANTCRFNGHTREFYSVAQHSVLASLLVDAPDANDRDDLMLQRAALLHDAHEAYLGDIPRPLAGLCEKLLACNWALEPRLHEVFGFPQYLPDWISAAIRETDARLLATEKRDVLAHPDVVWPEQPGEPIKFGRIGRCLLPAAAEALFINRWAELFGTDAVLDEAPPASTLFDAAGWRANEA